MSQEKQSSISVTNRPAQKTFVYAGNWTVQAKGAQGGIGIYEYREDGSLRYIQIVRKDVVAGMMCVDQQRGVLYVIDEQQNSPRFGMQGGGGRVIAFSIDPVTGALTELGPEQPTFSTLPTYVAQTGTGDYLLVVNHGDKQAITKTHRDDNGTYHVSTEFSDVTAVLYPLSKEGIICDACDVMFFPPDRNQYPAKIACLHAAYFAPGSDLCIVSNMKQDQVLSLRVDRANGRLERCDTLRCPTGNWPRYGAFHPTKKLFYLNNEHALLVDVIAYDDNGKLRLVQRLDATPQLPLETGDARVLQSDLRISADGRFVYDFCRGTETATVFAVDEETGLLEMVQSLQLREVGPRGAAISPDGRFVLVANVKSGAIDTLAIQPDGMLQHTNFTDRRMEFPGAVVFYSANAKS